MTALEEYVKEGGGLAIVPPVEELRRRNSRRGTTPATR